jgi:hypothetical protein
MIQRKYDDKQQYNKTNVEIKQLHCIDNQKEDIQNDRQENIISADNFTNFCMILAGIDRRLSSLKTG